MKVLNQLRGNILKVRRNLIWTIQMFLSIIVLCAMSDSFPPTDMNDTELFAYATSGLSIVISAIMSVMYYIERSKNLVGGTLFELVGATILLGLWIGAAVVIQDPENDIASTIDISTGIEVVQESNLYFFTWFTLFSNVYLVASFFKDVTSCDYRMLGWISLLAASLILLGVSRHLTDDICGNDDGAMCFRIQYATIGSAVSSFISFIASVLSYKSKISPYMGLVLASPNAIVYPFGAMLLTSSDGPGRTLGTIYFTIWFGSIISVLLLIGEFNGVFLDKEDTKETIGGNLPVASPVDKTDTELRLAGTKSSSDLEIVEKTLETVYAEAPSAGSNDDLDNVDLTLSGRMKSTIQSSYSTMFSR